MLILVIAVAHGQDSTKKFRKMVFKARVLAHDQLIAKGFLLQINDSSVALSQAPQPFMSGADYRDSPQKIHYSEIDCIELKRKGSVGKGILIGTIAGAAVGVLIGYASGDDDGFDENGNMILNSMNAGDKARVTGGVLGILGGLIGAVIGAVSNKRIYINRSTSGLKELNHTVLERIYSK